MRILLVDDHTVVRQGFRRLLADQFPDAEFGEAATSQDGARLATKEFWDLVVLDLTLQGGSGLDVLKEIRGQCPRLPVLVVTMHSEEQYALRAFKAGASGYLTKDAEPTLLFEAVRKILAGGKFLTPALGEILAKSLTNESATPHDALSDREFQVLRMLAAAKSVKDIAAELYLSEKTVSTYRTRVLEKLGLRTTADLIRYAMQNKLSE